MKITARVAPDNNPTHATIRLYERKEQPNERTDLYQDSF